MRREPVYRVLIAAVLMALSISRLAAAGLRFDFGPSPLDELRKAAGEQVKTAVCPRSAAPPKMDGKLDDPAWRDALAIQDFNFKKPATRVSLCYDDRALYIGVVCKELPGRTPFGKTRRRDTGAWQDDCIEMWLDPASACSSRAISPLSQFAVSLANAGRVPLLWPPASTVASK